VFRFADSNLQLAMIDEVYRRRTDYYWVEPTLRERYDALPPKKPWAELSDNICEHVPELQTLAAQLPITVDDLAAITSLTLDGDRDLYQWVYPSWWDFGDHFEIHDLRGLETCTGLEYVLLGQGLVENASLEPLAALRNLRELHLCALCGHRDREAVLSIPSLAVLDIANATSEWKPIMNELGARGVRLC
jgi:hypothetical protein